MISQALNELGVKEWVLKGTPNNESEFLKFFKKVIGVDSNNCAIESTNPNDFGVTWSQIEEKIQELEAAEPMRLLRIERNKILQQSDWRDLPSYPGTDQEAWRTYRQALRDITETQTPELDEFGNLTNITWPEEPA